MVDVIGLYSIRRELRERVDKGRLMVYLKDLKVSGTCAGEWLLRVDRPRKGILNGIHGTEKLGGIGYGWITLLASSSYLAYIMFPSLSYRLNCHLDWNVCLVCKTN